LVNNCGGIIQPFEVGTVGWIVKKLKRYRQPEEVAYAVIYLVSDSCKWVTGSSLKHVDTD
jgi:NAD(P)-dependent dehydrogenase (short-subunit alcohol dehydrogenase family)